MQIDYIRRDTPEEISENGGAYIQLVNKDTIGLKSSIAEAKSTLYVVGQDTMIEGYFVGLMRSVFEGIKEDGHPRTVGDVTIFPVCGGTFDLDKGWDPLVNDVRIKARLLNGLTLDITDWTFRDVTEGRVSYSIDTVSDGTTTGLVSTDKSVELNGRNFPAKSLLSVSWVCGTKSGTVDASKFTVNVARITIDASAFTSLTAAEDGKEIVFTVKGCYNKATKSATVRYVAPIFTSSLGGIRVMTAVDTNGNALPSATLRVSEATDDLTLTGVNIKSTDSEHPTTGITKAVLQGLEAEGVESTLEFDAAAGTMTLSLGMDVSSKEAGTYENLFYMVTCYTDGQPDSMSIPLKVVKE